MADFSKVNNIFSQRMVSNKRPLDPKLTVGSGQVFADIDDLLSYPDLLWEGLKAEDLDNSVTWQIYLDGSTWKKRIYDGMIHVKAIATGDIQNHLYPVTTIDGESIAYGDVVAQVGGTPQMNGLWVRDEDYETTYGLPYKRHPLFRTVDDQLSNVIIIADGGTVWKNSQWVFTTIGSLTGCPEDEDGSAADPELLTWFYWATRPTDLGLNMLDFGSLVNTAISDSWLNFDLVSCQSYKSLVQTSDTLVGRFNPQSLIDATSDNTDVSTDYNTYANVTSLFPNREYLVQKIDTTDHYVAFYERSTDVLPESVMIAKDDWCKFIFYQNSADVTDVDMYTHSNRRTYQVTVTGITADGDTGVDIPAGYSVFAIQGTTNSSTADTFNIGLAAVGNELIDGGSFSSAAEVINTYQELTVDLTTPRSIYLSMVGGWPGGNATSIDLTFVFYQDNF